MSKRLTIAIISLLALAMIVVLPVAAADNVIAAAGNTVFRGEEGLNIAATGVLAGETIGWYAAGSTPGFDSPSATVVVSNPAAFFVDAGMQTGAWYRQVAGTPLAFLVADPTLDVKLIDIGNNVKNDKTVIKGDVLRFRIDTNLDAFTQRVTAPATVGAPVRVRVTDPNGNVYTSLRDDTNTLVNVAANLVNTNPFIVTGAALSTGVWDTGNANYARGTYTYKVDCNANRMNDNYDVTGKTVSKTYSVTIADDDLIITSNKDTVVRNTDFAVTITGRPSTNYVLWTKGTANLVNTDVPAIKDGQQGVTKGSALAAAYVFSGVSTVGGDVPQVGLVPSVNHYAMVATNDQGKRTIGFSTTQNTKDQSFTIRSDEYVAPGPSGTYDEVKVKVEKGDVTITASGDRSYYLGEEIVLSGTNTDSADVFLFMTGPNLAANGADLRDPSVRVVDLVPGSFVQRVVKGDDTWEYKWDTSNLALDAGTYTIYAVAAARDKNNLQNVKYSTVSIVVRKSFVSASASQSSVAKGDKLYIRGNAEGNPTPGVAIWVLGRNFYQRATESVNDDATFEYELTGAATQNMASGQYFVVIQHPMGNNQFDVVENVVGVVSYVQTRDAAPMGIAPAVGANAFVAVGAGRLQGSDAAEALIQLINMANIDDTYTKLTFLVEEPWIRIDSVADKYVGSTFTITGTTNLGVGNDLIVEVTSSAFKPTEKTASGEFSGQSGTVKIVKGDAGYNTWSFEVSATAFKPDEYIINVESIEADASATSTFNIIEGVPVTQPPVTQPPVTQPPVTTVPATTVPATAQQPGFGALVAIAGLGAVAFLVLRRN
ncbi:MAG: MEMAR_RS02690 family S-layer glycoprotein [Candidatus Oleimmundimicrobium sp.]|nr:MEMAR_RS02690 family S-layer glycoprotein [Candidatus Oleimmundimicrobium sp.]